MAKTWIRPRDEHGRAYYAPNEVPPADEHFAHWLRRLTHPSAIHTPHNDHDRICVGGWIPSGEWWLHCGICRPPSPVVGGRGDRSEAGADQGTAR